MDSQINIGATIDSIDSKILYILLVILLGFGLLKHYYEKHIRYKTIGFS